MAPEALFGGGPGGRPGEERRKPQKPAENSFLHLSAAFCAVAQMLLHKYSGPSRRTQESQGSNFLQLPLRFPAVPCARRRRLLG
eukprot:5320432-Alexandrium_andersonii.AAC.1